MIRLMIVEDSATVREMLTYAFAAEADIVVAGVAKDGEEAVELVGKIKPDIVLMDINMPRLNGYQASQKIMEENPVPILLMSSTFTVQEVEKIVNSMHIGVLGVFEKPYGPGHPKYKELYDEILLNLRLMSDVKVVRRWNPNMTNQLSDFTSNQKIECKRGRSFIMIGSSTGGPPVLHTILKGLPHDYPLPILVAQHMSSEFIDSFVQWLNSECALNVKKAEDGEKISAGHVYIAPSSHHLTLEKNRIRLIKADKNELIVPSISKLFGSVSAADAGEAVVILLSGMGNDGAKEMTKLKQQGALTIGQDEVTSVVFGMAKEAIKEGGVEFVLPPQGIFELLLSMHLIKQEPL